MHERLEAEVGTEGGVPVIDKSLTAGRDARSE